MDKHDPIEDAEVVETEATDTEDAQAIVDKAVQTQLELESIIHRYLKDVAQTRERVKEKKNMLDAAFENDAEYAGAQEKVKEATKIKRGIQQKIQTQPAIKMLADEVLKVKEELKDAQEALSQYLRQYAEKTGARLFTGEDGEVMEIITTHKLVKQK